MEYRLGIVCSGGGVRAVAHIGVLHALTERGLAPECLSGTSAGALVAALYAAGHSTEKMLELFESHSPFKLSNLSFGKPGLIDTAKVRAALEQFFPEDSFEALDRRLFVTATDLVNAKLVIFESGPLIRTLLASSSVPAVFTPTEIEGRVFADGGIIDNFPVGPLLGLCDVILGVHVNPLRSVKPQDLSSTRVVVNRALELVRYFNSKSRFHECDVMLCPEALDDYMTFDTRNVQKIFDVGYREAVAKMGTIEAAIEAVVR